MFDIEGGWKKRFTGAALPAATKRKGWLIAHDDEPAFVEPILRVVQGDPETARVIVVAAPGAVGKSTYARKLSASAAAIFVDLASTESLGGNFFTGGIANAFGYNALADAAEGRLALIVDALDEAQLRSGAQGFADGLSDLARIVEQPKALPAALFGRAAAAEEAWLISPLTKSARLDSDPRGGRARGSDGTGSATGSAIGDAGVVVGDAALAGTRVLRPASG